VKTLLIGGARSGKSSLAQRWAAERSGANTAANSDSRPGASTGSNTVCSIVTGTESDPEMVARIAAHRRDRPPHWRVHEEPIRLGQALRTTATTGDVILVDCLTLWISNCLWPTPPDQTLWPTERDDFLDALRTSAAEVIIVTNEVGTGIVPDNAAARTFRDEQGWLNQSVAALCDEVFLVTAGLPLRLKPT
jgi:adenosylcobinamide kinase / adenosylcobinamide-phosphate guanylyltransferase